MKYKNVPIDQVISKVIADLDISEESQRMDDYTEWASEAIELIGAPLQLETVSNVDDEASPIKVNGYQGRIPNDAVNILSVYYSDRENGPFIKINKSTSINQSQKNQSYDVYYYFKPGYICVNKESGYIKVIYQRHQRDTNGRLLIPNLISYIEAIYWYIVMKLTYPRWRVGMVRDQVYYDSKKSWRFFRNKAYGDIMMPTLDDMRNIKNTWNRLVPNPSEDANDFAGIGNQEKVRF